LRYKENEIVDAFIFPQTKEKYIGKVKLLQFKELGLPYTLNDTISIKIRPVFINEIWKAEIVESSLYSKGFKLLVKLRTIQSIGSKSKQKTNDARINNNPVILDRFDILPNYNTDYWDKQVDGSETSGHQF
jgi:hypothetical protein